MITKITLPNRVPFDQGLATLDGLNRVCFLFGPNGSGKTTISQLISDEANGSSTPHLEWSTVAPTRTYVYNHSFIKSNFADDASVPGVFTMGKDAVDAQAKIDELNAAIKKENKKKDSAEANLEQATQDLEAINANIRDTCWTVRAELPESVRSIWANTGRKEPFRDALLAKIGELKPADVQPDIADIEHRVSIVFDSSATAFDTIPTIDLTELTAFESEAILQKKIVGKEDLPIAALITKLGNSDWVAQGRKYIVQGDLCPFCQKPTITEDIKKEMDEFFDETYEADKTALTSVSERYSACADAIIHSFDRLLETHEQFIDVPVLKARLAELKGNVQENKARIEKKLDEPSIPIALVSVVDICDGISLLISKASGEVTKHNDMINNRSEQKRQVIADIWIYAAMVAKPRVSIFDARTMNTKKRIEGLEKKTVDIAESIAQMTSDLAAVERSLTNVKETADAINDLLVKFGFVNFKLAVTADNKYRIERLDGTLVNDTLSEGETSFLTFLYFYYLMRGSQEASGTTDSRIVIIDDPVSSMDADVLFVASSLVRRLANEAREGSGRTEQLIVLTHNITFHREVTYAHKKGDASKTSYYVIRKNGGHSSIEQCDEDPISSTYELLWKDFCRTDCSPLTAQNVARRITETFFKLVGGDEPFGIVSGMASPDREIARSYMAWANAGSHSPFDDETYFNTGENIEVYRRVLRTIFDNAGYANHYDEMVAKFGAIDSDAPQ